MNVISERAGATPTLLGLPYELREQVSFRMQALLVTVF